MNSKLNKIFSVFVLLLVFGCKPAEKHKKPVESGKEVATVVPKETISAGPKIKPFSLTFTNLIENNRLNKLPVLTKNEIENYSIVNSS
jgi:flagella basal body P-ring formation protein FlgA